MTYWIDRALSALEDAKRTGQSDARLLSGNATTLLIEADHVIARSDYEVYPDEAMPVADFVELLEVWRTKVLDALRRKGRAD